MYVRPAKIPKTIRIYVIRRPLSLDKAVRRVVLSAPSLFPSPTGPKTYQFVLRHNFGNELRAFIFEH